MNRKVYQHIASRLEAIENCRKSGNDEWLHRHGDAIEWLVKNHLPSGSGVDLGTRFDDVKSKPDRLVFEMSFHHMDEHGGYDGWTSHQVVVTPSLAHGFLLSVKGRDRNDIKDYLHEIYSYALDVEVDDAVLANVA